MTVELIEIEDFKQFYNENKEEIDTHYKEYSSHFSDNKTVDVDTELHQDLIDAEVMFCYEIEVDDEYCGYVSLVITPSMLFKGTLEVTINNIFIKQEFRGNSVASTCIAKIEKLLLSKGLKEYYLTLPSSPMFESMANKMGMLPSSVVYNKKLGV